MRRILTTLNVPLALAQGAVAGGIAQHLATLDGLRLPGFTLGGNSWWHGFQVPLLIVVAALATLIPPRYAAWPLALVGDLGLWWRLDVAHDRLLDRGSGALWFMFFTGLVVGGTLAAITAGDERPGTVPRLAPVAAFGAAFLVAPHLGDVGLLDLAGEPVRLWRLLLTAGVTVVAAGLAFLVPTPAVRRPWGPVAVAAIVAALAYGVDRYVVSAYSGGPTPDQMAEGFIGPFWWGAGLTLAGVVLVGGFALRVTGGAVARWMLVVPMIGIIDAVTIELPMSTGRLWEYVGCVVVALVLARYVRSRVPWEAVLLAVGSAAMLGFGQFMDASRLTPDNRGTYEALAFGWLFGTLLAYVFGTLTAGSGVPERGARRVVGPGDLVLGFGLLVVAVQHLAGLNTMMELSGRSYRSVGVSGLVLAALAAVVFVVSWWRGRRAPEPADPTAPAPDFVSAPTQYVSDDEADPHALDDNDEVVPVLTPDPVADR